MPESLRATKEELEKANSQEPEPMEEPDLIEEPVDELSWMDELAEPDSETQEQAELAEDLTAANLIPEEQPEEKIYATEELKSPKIESPDWLDELSDEDKTLDGEQERDLPDISATEEETAYDQSLLPDWLSELSEDAPPADAEPTPDELDSDIASDPVSSEFPEMPADEVTEEATEEQAPEPAGEVSGSLAWLESLAEKQGVPEEQLTTTSEERDLAEPPQEDPIVSSESLEPQDVSPDDDTLSTAIPDWLSKIAESEKQEQASASQEDQNDFEESASWLEQLEETPTGELREEDPTRDSEVLEWLEGMNEESSAASPPAEDIEEASPAELETAKYYQEEEQVSEEMPDWLSELGDEEQDSTLDSALKQSGHTLSEEEVEFIEHKEEIEEDNADWLAKLDLGEEDSTQQIDTPAIKVDVSEVEEEPAVPENAFTEDVSVSGGILDRLKDTGAIESEPDVPQWLENLKKEEDPQETAILWLKQFVERGDQANLTDEIKRYTSELNPGDTVPKWMEDLKNEEDPQTTAMLWLEKLSGERPPPEKPKTKAPESDESDWLTALEKEEEEQSQTFTTQPTEEFLDSNDGWLADLEIDEKIKTEDDQLPDWSDSEEEDPESEEDGETPPWMKSTSPLEGDFHTDELAGSEKEVEIPEWLAGYGEGEKPDEDPPELTQADPEPQTEDEDYTWVSASSDKPKPAKTLIDLNKAAISQLEGILGISYQVARGVIRYREEHGPYRDIMDLLNVPEISDEQTIEILKPEVFIGEVEEAAPSRPTPTSTSKPKSPKPALDPGEMLSKARADLAESNIEEAIAGYDVLIKKKKSLPEVIKDLEQAAIDHPIDIPIIKTLGDAYMKDNNLEKALEAYSKAEDLLH
jgi:hypothetical protein